MKKLMILLFVLFINAGAYAGTVTIENAERYWFYYVLDPDYLKDYNYKDPLFNNYVSKFFASETLNIKFYSLAPGEMDNFNNLLDGEHLLIGFFISDSKLIYPVKIIQISWQNKDESKRYVVYNTASNISVTKGAGILAKFEPDSGTTSSQLNGITIDNNYKDWTLIPIIASFANTFNPYYFSREAQQSLFTLPIENSLYWSRGGTQIKDIKVILSQTRFYLSISTYSKISRGLLLYAYLFKERTETSFNKYSMEFNIFKNNIGKIYLWERGVKTPVDVGNLAHTSYSLEAEVDLTLLPQALKTELIDKYSFDFTTCFFDTTAQMYEEFYFTSIYFKDIPTYEDLKQ